MTVDLRSLRFNCCRRGGGCRRFPVCFIWDGVANSRPGAPCSRMLTRPAAHLPALEGRIGTCQHIYSLATRCVQIRRTARFCRCVPVCDSARLCVCVCYCVCVCVSCLSKTDLQYNGLHRKLTPPRNMLSHTCSPNKRKTCTCTKRLLPRHRLPVVTFSSGFFEAQDKETLMFRTCVDTHVVLPLVGPPNISPRPK